ncbi:sulfatase-like hydrolase/transferase [Paludibaculum fermentans]|uniref:Sulfatase-like hydrolase/transferase n=1 Tax=Paludibaculum fermentans TaxID=1473598 RepID=A0A7S7NV12_PALFE|nr:sulfatase-like hydrolase/transferase [Paludibaculum fermentans]QOY90332.1 sulfatase-like hydrolase/transferase [Paludibaculum fermentans]
MTFTRRQIMTAAAGLVPRLDAGPKKRPNILVLLTDDQRFSTLHAINNPEVQTPTMDRLASRGTTFTHGCIMGGTIPAVCSPSRAMLLTGQSLFHVTDSIVTPRSGPDSVARPFEMFPELFRRNGYRTFGTGKWHNGEPLYARCFADGGNIFFGGMSDHLKVPIADYDASGQYPKEKRYTGAKFSSELFSDSAVDFLDRYKGDDPFVMYVAYTAPHDPRMAPKRYLDRYPWQDIKLPANFLPQHPFDNGELRIRDEMLAPFPRTPDVVKQNIAAYYAMITEVDEQMGRVVQALERSGRAENTIIVMAGDNGLALGQHGLMGKQSLYDHSIRVPLIVGGPGLPAGKRSDALCYLMDLYPTLCDAAALKAPSNVEGRSLMPLLTGHKTRIRDSVFLAYRDFQRGVRTDRWKLIVYNVKGQETVQLFDLLADPLEQKNLAADASHAHQVRELRQLLKRWMTETQDRVDLDKADWGRT